MTNKTKQIILAVSVVAFFVITASLFKQASAPKNIGGPSELEAVSIKKIKYIPAERNYTNIRFSALREKIDYKYNDAHDALSKAYYEGTEFEWKGKNYGVLDKETFDKMQSKIWQEYLVLFDEENKKQALPIPESEYNEEYLNEEGKTKTKVDKAKEEIKALEKEKIDIKL
jgi:hypothetical protein